MEYAVAAGLFCALLAALALFWLFKYRRDRVAIYYRDYVRYVILALACFLMVGSSGGYDSPSTLNRMLQEWLDVPFSTFQYQFNMLYSAYSLPNVVLPVFAGSAIERIGFSAMLLTLTSFVFAGVLVYAIGVTSKLFTWMLIGRILLGIGSESLTIAQSSLVTKYFISADLSFALAVTMSMSRLTSVMNYTVMPKVATAYGVPNATWMAVGMCTFSLVAAILAVLLDKYNTGRQRAASGTDIGDEEVIAICEPDQQDDTQGGVRDMFLNADNNIAVPNVASAATLKHRSSAELLREVPDREAREPLVQQQSTAAYTGTTSGNSPPRTGMKRTTSNDRCEANKKVGAAPAHTAAAIELMIAKFPRPLRWIFRLLPLHCLEFPRTFWLTTASLICYSTATITFIPMAPAFLEQKYFPGDYVSASSFVSIPDTFSVVMLPLAGIVADRLSKRRRNSKGESVSSSTTAQESSYTRLPTSPTTNEAPTPMIISTSVDSASDSTSSAAVTIVAPATAADSTPTTSTSLSQANLHSLHTKSMQILLSGLFIFVAHLEFTFTEWHPLLPLLTLGVGYSAYGSVLYSLMAEIVAPPGTAPTPMPQLAASSDNNKAAQQQSAQPQEEDGRVASAYGLSGCLVNAVFFLTPLIVAYLLSAGSVDEGNTTVVTSVGSSSSVTNAAEEEEEGEIRSDAAGYFRMECFFSLISLCGVLAAYKVHRIIRREMANEPTMRPSATLRG